MEPKDYVADRRHIMSTMIRLRKATPDVVAAFGELNKQATADGALSKKYKELIAAAISVVVQCEGCMEAHIDDALRSGASHDEIVDALGVAILMAGGPGAVYAAKGYEILEQFEAKYNR